MPLPRRVSGPTAALLALGGSDLLTSEGVRVCVCVCDLWNKRGALGVLPVVLEAQNHPRIPRDGPTKRVKYMRI